MILDRTKIRKGMMSDLQDDNFINASMRKRIEMVWDITSALWSVSTKGKINAESRLQRHVVVFKKGGS